MERRTCSLSKADAIGESIVSFACSVFYRSGFASAAVGGELRLLPI